MSRHRRPRNSTASTAPVGEPAGRRDRRPAFPRARKRFGQHFLEPAWVTRLVEAVAPSPDDTFIEIGPGRGALTHPLSRSVARVIAVEIDRDLAAALPQVLPPNVQVVQGDVLDLDLHALVHPDDRPVRIVGNLPYNAASPILFKLLDAADEGRFASDATLMLQREVADRLVAPPGTRDHGALALQVSLLADVERLFVLPGGAFRPPPKVSSAVVRLRFRPPLVDVGNRDTFVRIVRGVFLHRRKTLVNALRPVAASLGRSALELIERAAVDPRTRPEALTLDDMARLSRAVL
jgi:16S rRNA (adenine1518-N6/adenine1519-N6)-dimethyltransferase